jgi:hypothetical protein
MPFISFTNIKMEQAVVGQQEEQQQAPPRLTRSQVLQRIRDGNVRRHRRRKRWRFLRTAK